MARSRLTEALHRLRETGPRPIGEFLDDVDDELESFVDDLYRPPRITERVKQRAGRLSHRADIKATQHYLDGNRPRFLAYMAASGFLRHLYIHGKPMRETPCHRRHSSSHSA